MQFRHLTLIVMALVVTYLGMLAIFFGSMILHAVSSPAFQVTASAVSPDKKTRVELVEGVQHLDRNFTVRLGPVETSTSHFERIFRSPDEGHIGTERFIWSNDGTHVLLVGKQFFVTTPAPTMTTGEDIYLLYHLPTKKLWCNASQGNYQRFTFKQLALISFTERIAPTPPVALPPTSSPPFRD